MASYTNQNLRRMRFIVSKAERKLLIPLFEQDLRLAAYKRMKMHCAITMRFPSAQKDKHV